MSGNLISRLWAGQLNLPPTYWLFGVVSLAWFVWIFVGIWRAAEGHDGSALLATLARTGVCIGIVRMAGEAPLLGAVTL